MASISELIDTSELTAESDSYYGKVKAFSVPYRTYPPSSLIDFEKFPISEADFPIEERQMWDVWNPTRLTSLIREKENGVSHVSEGLIKTAKKEILQRSFHKFCMENIPHELCSLNIHKLYPKIEDDVKLVDFVMYNEPEMEISPLVRFAFALYASGDRRKDAANAEEISREMTDELYPCGYNFSKVNRIPDGDVIQPFEKRKVLLYIIQFEAKFSDIDFKMAPFLYHVTLKRYIKKINTRGLVPSSKSAMFKYPKRVYLFNFHDDRTTAEMICAMKGYMSQRILSILHSSGDISSRFNPEIDRGFYIIKINADKLKNSPLFKNGKMKFYIDACYDGAARMTKDSKAIFTYNNIPRNLMEDDAMFFPILSFDRNNVNFGKYEFAKINEL